jgi:hypothetical protein
MQNGSMVTVTPTQAVFDTTNFDSPGSSRYFYEAWLYVDSNYPVNQNNVIWYRGVPGSSFTFAVVLNGTKLSIYVPGSTSNGNVGTNGILNLPAATDATNLMDITSSFPFQKWTHLVINVENNQNVDSYIDGKLVYSTNTLNATPSYTLPSDANSSIYIGNNFTQGKITRFQRPAVNINPQDVWTLYMQGNGEGISIMPYHMNIQVLKNGNKRIDQRVI